MLGETVGHLVRGWRTSRGLSQADLGEAAGFSARHVSFIETGKSRPSREALLALAETLGVPLRERNTLLRAAGFADMFRETPLGADEMAPVRDVLQFLLDRHLPYAALVLDRHSNCLIGNRSAGKMLEMLIEPPLLSQGANLLRVVFHPNGVRRSIVNWDEICRHQLARAERDFGSQLDAAGVQLLQELRGYAGLIETPAVRASPYDLLLPIHIRRGDLELRLFSTIMTLGTPQDVTLQELRLETFFPADAASESQWRRLFT